VNPVLHQRTIARDIEIRAHVMEGFLDPLMACECASSKA
jgi:hypothetical protein